jgi:predicted AAA+ superfamily ATPase
MIKFIFSGTSISHLFDNSKESLLGRCLTINISPLNLWQFAAFKNKYGQILPEDDLSEMLNLMSKYNLIKEPLEYYESLKDNYAKLLTYQSIFTNVVNEFLLVGGYLEYFSSNDINDWQSRLIDITYYILYKDIIGFSEITNGKKLQELFQYVVDNYWVLFSFHSIGTMLNISPITVSRYLNYLENANLIIIQEIHANHVTEKLKSKKRILVLDNGIKNSIKKEFNLNFYNTDSNTETAITSYSNNICKDKHWLANYKDKTNMDLIIDKRNTLLPIKIQYSNQDDLKTKGLPKETNQNTISFIITKDILKKENNTLYIPFWLIK